jgi:hypothetical protein
MIFKNMVGDNLQYSPQRILLMLTLFLLIIGYVFAAPTTSSDANALWNDRNGVTFTCDSNVGCKSLNYRLNNGEWVDVDYLLSDGIFNLKGDIYDGTLTNGIWGDGEYIYLANSGDGIYAYDFNGTDFELKGNRADGGTAYGVWSDGDYVYLASGDGIYAYDFNGTDFILKGNRNDGGYAYDIWGDGEYIYLANYTNGIYAYDFNGTDFILKDNRDDGGGAIGVWGDGEYIYLISGDVGVDIYAYDFNGTDFILKDNSNVGGNTLNVWGDGEYIYLANGGDGIYAYDFNGTDFELKGNRDDGGYAYDIWGDGNYIYLANSGGGIYAYDFNGTDFILKGNRDDGGSANSIWGDGEYVYLDNSGAGIYAYDFNGIIYQTIVVPDGNNKIEFFSTDIEDNNEAAKTVYHAYQTPDSDPPVTTSSGCGVGWNNTNQTITLDCDDSAGSGCDTTQYRLNGGEWNNYTIPFTLSTDLNHQIDFNSTDVAGNSETTKTSYCAIDSTAPALNNIDNNGIWFKNDFNISFDVNFSISEKYLAQYRIDNGAWADFATDFNIPIITDGNFIIDANFTDNANNSLLVYGTQALLDKTNPILHSFSPANNSEGYSTNISFDFNELQTINYGLVTINGGVSDFNYLSDCNNTIDELFICSWSETNLITNHDNIIDVNIYNDLGQSSTRTIIYTLLTQGGGGGGGITPQPGRSFKILSPTEEDIIINYELNKIHTQKFILQNDGEVNLNINLQTTNTLPEYYAIRSDWDGKLEKGEIKEVEVTFLVSRNMGMNNFDIIFYSGDLSHTKTIILEQPQLMEIKEILLFDLGLGILIWHFLIGIFAITAIICGVMLKGDMKIFVVSASIILIIIVIILIL